MKRNNVVLIALFLTAPILMGQLSQRSIQPVMLSSPQSRWQELGTIPPDFKFEPAVTRGL